MTGYLGRNTTIRIGRRFVQPRPIVFDDAARVRCIVPAFAGIRAGSGLLEESNLALTPPDFAGLKSGRAQFDTAQVTITTVDFEGVGEASSVFDTALLALTAPDFDGLIAGLQTFDTPTYSISVPDFDGFESGAALFDTPVYAIGTPGFVAFKGGLGVFDTVTVSVSPVDFLGFEAGIGAFDTPVYDMTAPDFDALLAAIGSFDSPVLDITVPDFTGAPVFPTLVINSIGPQQSDGDVPVDYTLTGAASQLYDLVLYDPADGDPTLASQFNGGDADYTDIGQATLDDSGSPILLTGPDGLQGTFRKAFLPVGGGDGDIVVSPSFALDSTGSVLSPVSFVGGSGAGEVDWSFTPDEDSGSGIGYRVSLWPDGTDPSDALIKSGTGAVASSTGTATGSAAESGTLTGSASVIYQPTIYYVDAFGNEIFETYTDVTAAAGASFTPNPIGLAGQSNRLERSTAFANSQDATTQMLFACVDLPTTWTNTIRPIKVGAGESGLRINTDGNVIARAYTPAGVQIEVLNGATGAVAGDRLCMWAGWDTNGDCELWAKVNAGAWALIESVAIATGVLIDNTLTNGTLEMPKNISEDFDAVLRVSAWLNGETPPDFSNSAVQDNFALANGDPADPALSRAAYGIPAIDKYLAASTWNAGTGNNEGNGGDFTTDGGFTDV